MTRGAPGRGPDGTQGAPTDSHRPQTDSHRPQTDSHRHLTDSHCHLTDSAFADDLDEVLVRAARASVRRVVAIASDACDARRALELAETGGGASDGPAIWCTSGVHPHSAGASSARTDMGAVRDAASHPRCVAVGETGLDYHYDFAPRDRQRRSFAAHVELAADLEMPLVVHSRNAENDTAAVIDDCAGRVRGVLHCFTGPARLLELALEAGWMVSYTGIASFKSFDGSLARRTPADRYMIETDSPYLAPAPRRGRRNEPALVARVAEALAEHRGEPAAKVARDSWDSAERFFGLSGAGG